MNSSRSGFNPAREAWKRARLPDPHAPMFLTEKAALYAPIFTWIGARIQAGELRAPPQWALDPVVFGPAQGLARRWRAVAPDPPDPTRQGP